MFLLALTGGIAAGKSTVAKRLAEHGAVVIDADELARDLVEPGKPILGDLVREFGKKIIATDGSLRRSVLAQIVFSDPQRRAALDAIMHPAVRLLLTERINQIVAADPSAVIVYDVPLFVESGHSTRFDLVVVVHAAEEKRINRLVTERAMTLLDATNRVSAQAHEHQRLAVADVVISSDGSLSETLAQTDALWQRISLLTK